MAQLTQTQAREFIKQCRILQSLDFPLVASGLNINYRKDIKPLLKEIWFRDEMEDMLEAIKFTLVSKLYEAATKPSLPGRVPPPAVHIKEMMKLIDSGILLGAKEEVPKEPALSEEEEQRARHRLGLNDVTKEPQDD